MECICAEAKQVLRDHGYIHRDEAATLLISCDQQRQARTLRIRFEREWNAGWIRKAVKEYSNWDTYDEIHSFSDDDSDGLR